MGSVSTIYNGVRTWLAGRALMDVAFSNRSTNGVQNKVIKAKFDEVEGEISEIKTAITVNATINNTNVSAGGISITKSNNFYEFYISVNVRTSVTSASIGVGGSSYGVELARISASQATELGLNLTTGKRYVLGNIYSTNGTYSVSGGTSYWTGTDLELELNSDGSISLNVMQRSSSQIFTGHPFYDATATQAIEFRTALSVAKFNEYSL